MGSTFLIGGFLMWSFHFRPEPFQTAPVIPQADIWRLTGYKQECNASHLCEPPLVCVDDERVGLSRCLVSECWTDQQCGPDHTCQLVYSHTPGTMVRACTVEGIQDEGDPCWALAQDVSKSCKRGLICITGTCSRPCDPDEPTSCDEGYACATGRYFNVCVKSCLKSGCPAGKRCYHIGNEDSVASECGDPEPAGTDCEKVPCPVGQKCIGWISQFTYPQMECITPCDPQKPCAKGQLCMYGSCTMPCNPKQSNTCPEWTTCNYSPYDNVWFCGGS